jgi:ATP-dependent DNA ligase
MRNLSELKAECAKYGVSVLRSGKREAKSDYEKCLAKFFWKRDHGDEQMPPQLHPMLARNLKDLTEAEAEYMWASTKWVAQEKIDGCRLLMFIGPNGNYFTSRRLSDKTYRYAENTAQLPHLSGLITPHLFGTVIDGEIQSPKAQVNTGKVITLNVLQATVALLALNPTDSARVQREQDCELIFRVFDILQFRGEDVTSYSWSRRQKYLAESVQHLHALFPNCKIELVPTVQLAKKAFYEEVVKKGGEGIMLKDIDSPYEPSSSRTKAMYKVKRFEELDAFVTGFAPGDAGAGWEKMIGGLEVSCFDETSRALHPVAWVTNLSFDERCEATCCALCGEAMVVQWKNDNGKRVVEWVKCTQHGEQKPTLNKTWYNKVLVVRGQEITARVLRLKHAAIVSERNDKPVEECTINLASWKAKFDSKGAETGVTL